MKGGRYNLGLFKDDTLVWDYYNDPVYLYDIDSFTTLFETEIDLKEELKGKLLIDDMSRFNVKIHYQSNKETKVLPVIYKDLKKILYYGKSEDALSYNVDTELKRKMLKTRIINKINNSSLFDVGIKEQINEFLLSEYSRIPNILKRYKTVRMFIIKLNDLNKLRSVEDVEYNEFVPKDSVQPLYQTEEEEEFEKWERTR